MFATAVMSILILSRRTHGGRKLWESKDERKWGHDKFEEITLQERHYEEVIIMLIFITNWCQLSTIFYLSQSELCLIVVHPVKYSGEEIIKGSLSRSW